MLIVHNCIQSQIRFNSRPGVSNRGILKLISNFVDHNVLFNVIIIWLDLRGPESKGCQIATTYSVLNSLKLRSATILPKSAKKSATTFFRKSATILVQSATFLIFASGDIFSTYYEIFFCRLFHNFGRYKS